MLREPTLSERALIEGLLAQDDEQLLAMLGYSAAPPGVLFAAPAAVERGREWLRQVIAEQRTAICAAYAEWKKDPRAAERAVLVAAVADILTGLLGGPGGVFNLAVLLVRFGLDRICRGELPAVEAEPS